MTTILIDNRIGSGEFAPRLRGLGAKIELTRLGFGDFAFYGNGPEGKVKVGIERKTIRDLAQSFVNSRLTGHQLPGLVKEYGFWWIVVEGIWRPTDDGSIETYGGGWKRPQTTSGKGSGGRRFAKGSSAWVPLEIGLSYAELDRFLCTIEMKAGGRIRRTQSPQETAHVIYNLSRWWDKPWDGHRSHLSFDRSMMIHPDRHLMRTPNLVELWAKELPGIGWEKSKIVAKRFDTPADMVEADAGGWKGLKGKSAKGTMVSIGPKTIEGILRAIHGKERFELMQVAGEGRLMVGKKRKGTGGQN